MDLKNLQGEEAVLEEMGKRIARHRLNQNMTQQQLAREAGVGVMTVHRLEQGQSIQVSNLIRVLRILGLSVGLDSLLPDVPVSPIQQARSRQKVKLRAFPRKKKTKNTRWSWGV